MLRFVVFLTFLLVAVSVSALAINTIEQAPSFIVTKRAPQVNPTKKPKKKPTPKPVEGNAVSKAGINEFLGMNGNAIASWFRTVSRIFIDNGVFTLMMLLRVELCAGLHEWKFVVWVSLQRPSQNFFPLFISLILQNDRTTRPDSHQTSVECYETLVATISRLVLRTVDSKPNSRLRTERRLRFTSRMDSIRNGS